MMSDTALIALIVARSICLVTDDPCRSRMGS
jgi:hypothetical protein